MRGKKLIFSLTGIGTLPCAPRGLRQQGATSSLTRGWKPPQHLSSGMSPGWLAVAAWGPHCQPCKHCCPLWTVTAAFLPGSAAGGRFSLSALGRNQCCQPDFSPRQRGGGSLTAAAPQGCWKHPCKGCSRGQGIWHGLRRHSLRRGMLQGLGRAQPGSGKCCGPRVPPALAPQGAGVRRGGRAHAGGAEHVSAPRDAPCCG